MSIGLCIKHIPFKYCDAPAAVASIFMFFNQTGAEPVIYLLCVVAFFLFLFDDASNDFFLSLSPFHSNLCSFVYFMCVFHLFFTSLYEWVCIGMQPSHVKNAPATQIYTFNGNEPRRLMQWESEKKHTQTTRITIKKNSSTYTFRMCLCVTWVNFNWIILIWFETKRSIEHTESER